MFYFPKATGGYESRMQPIKHRSSEEAFDLFDLYFRWDSCAGELLWMRRMAIDARSNVGADAKPQKQLVLLDRYDRLVAMEWHKQLKVTFKEAYSDAQERQDGEQVVRKYSNRELRLYGDFSNQLVLEILTSYATLQAQLARKAKLDELRR